MKQLPETVSLRGLMEGDDGWGREEGAAVGKRFAELINSRPEVSVFRISLDGVRRTDASFPRESVLKIAKQFRKAKGFCLVDVADEDILDNWEAAAQKSEQPLVVWIDARPRIMGPRLSESLRTLFLHLATNGPGSTGDVAVALGLGVPNASNQLRKLWDEGFVLRDERVAPSGGIEYDYYVPR